MRHCAVLCEGVVVALNTFIAPLTRATGDSRPRRTRLSPRSHCATAQSNSHSIYANLTAEEAIMRGVVLRKEERLLFLYRNDPCVVVGRNQNIFAEVALRRAACDGVKVARRSSGGGAVYQDAGNLCLSFFTHRAGYAPEKTIQILRLGLCALYGVAAERLTTTKRHDLYLDGLKITGSAMRVQRDIALHHCTLLVDTPVSGIGRYLHGEGVYSAFRTSSVGSVRSPVTTMAAKGLVTSPNTAARVHNGDGVAVAQAQALLADFFVRHGSFIASHTAPWDLTLDEVLANAATPVVGVDADKDAAASAGLVTLDVAALAHESSPTPFLVGEGRPVSSTDCATFQGEVARISDVEWQFAMPPFTSLVAVHAAEVGLGDEVPEEAKATAAALRQLLFPPLETGEASALTLQTTVEHRRIVGISVALSPAAAALAVERSSESGGDVLDGTPLLWLTAFAEALLVGSNCDAALESSFPVGGDGRDAILQGLRMELSRAEAATALSEQIPEELRVESILSAVQTVLSVWHHKNVFDFSKG